MGRCERFSILSISSGLVILFLFITHPAGLVSAQEIPGKSRSVEDWLDDLKVGDPKSRIAAVKALGNLKPQDGKTTTVLIAALKDEVEFVRFLAGSALVKIGKVAVPHLVEALRDKDGGIRSAVASILSEIGPPASDAVPGLVKAIDDSETEVRIWAAHALGKISADVSIAIPALLKALKDEDENVRSSADFALDKIGHKAVEALPNVIKALDDHDESVQIAAIKILGKIGSGAGSAVPKLIELVRKERSEITYLIFNVLLNIGKPAVPDLTKALMDENKEVRRIAIYTLDRIGAGYEAFVPALIGRLMDEDPDVRSDAARSLIFFKKDAYIAIPNLIKALRDKNANVRESAAGAIGRLVRHFKGIRETINIVNALIETLEDSVPSVRRTAGKGLTSNSWWWRDYSVPVFIVALKNKDAFVRKIILETLGNMDSRAVLAVPVIAESLKDPLLEIRIAAAEALGDIGPFAAQAVSELIDSLDDEEVEFREKVVRSLGDIESQPDKSVPALISVLRDDVKSVKFRASGALTRFGKSAVSPLIQVLNEPNHDIEVYRGIAHALGGIKADAREAIPALIESLKRIDDDHFKVKVACAFGYMGPCAKDSVESLIDLLKESDYFVRFHSIIALGRIGPEAKKAVPILANLLKDNVGGIRSGAAYALGLIGEEAKAAIPALLKAANDEFEHVRKAAKGAIKKINKEYRQPDKQLLLDLIKLRGREGYAGRYREEIEKEIESRRETIEPEIIALIEDILDGKTEVGDEKEALIALAELLASRSVDSAFLGTKNAIPILRNLLGHKDRYVRNTAIRSLDSHFSLDVIKIYIQDGFSSEYDKGLVGNVKRKSLEYLLHGLGKGEEEMRIWKKFRDGLKSPENLDRVCSELKTWFDDNIGRMHAKWDKERRRNVLILDKEE